MADNAATTTPTKGGWTDTEKVFMTLRLFTRFSIPKLTPLQYKFLFQIIQQLGVDKTVKYEQLDMPGRTPKALQHVWTKIKQEVVASEGGPVTPTVPKSRKKKADTGMFSFHH